MPSRDELNRKAVQVLKRAMDLPSSLTRIVMIDEALRLHREAMEAPEAPKGGADKEPPPGLE